MIQYKHIVRLAFIGLMINIIVNTSYYRYFMIKELVTNQVDIDNEWCAHFYIKNVWQKHKIAVNKLRKYSHTELLQDSDFIKFAVASADAFANINTEITVYDLRGNEMISTSTSRITRVDDYPEDKIYQKILNKIDQYFFKQLLVDQALNSAFNGNTIHVIVPKAIWHKPNGTEKASFVTSYIPIIDFTIPGSPVDGVIEINSDITTLWSTIQDIETKVFGTFIITLLISTIIIILNTHYAQNVVGKQFEINKNLEETIEKVKNESTAHSQFFTNVSHELRTPLNAIIGFSELMMSEPYNPVHKGYIKDIHQAGMHLLDIINDILDLSKASAEKLAIDFVELDLNKLVTSTVRLMQPRADEAKVQLASDLPRSHVIMKADPKRLKQVFLNLLSNSIKFTNQNGSVTISVKEDESKGLVYIKVVDTGIGIDERNIPKVLSEFGQVDNELSRKYEGTGLGLPLTRKLVALMKGTFDLRSVVGEGTTITLAFPYDSSIEA
jgi:two-component system cell cycle sensor histidine kinase PleC